MPLVALLASLLFLISFGSPIYFYLFAEYITGLVANLLIVFTKERTMENLSDKLQTLEAKATGIRRLLHAALRAPKKKKGKKDLEQINDLQSQLDAIDDEMDTIRFNSQGANNE